VKIRNILISKLPGIDRQFSVDGIGDGIQILHGPNGIGKSSIGRAMEGIFWESAYEGQSIIVTASLQDGSDDWKAEREGSRVSWRKNGVSSGPPSMPDQHLSHCFFLRLSDLLNETDRGANEFAERIQRQLSGGYDMAEVRSNLFKPIKKTYGNQQYSNYSQASDVLEKAVGEQGDLRAREDDLERIGQKILKAEQARDRLLNVGLANELAGHLSELDNLQNDLGALSLGLEKLSGSELEDVERYQSAIQVLENKKQAYEQARQSAEFVERDAGLGAEIDPVELADLQSSEKSLITLESQLGTLLTDVGKQRPRVLAAQHSVGKTEEKLTAGFDVPQSKELLEFLDRAQNVDRQFRTLEEQISFVDNLGSASDRTDGDPVDKLSDGRRFLLTWLRQGDLSISSPGISPRVVLIAGLIGIVAGSIVAFWNVLVGLFAAAFGAGLVVATFTKGKATSTHDYKTDAEEGYLKLGITPPANWNDVEVEGKLRELDQVIAKKTAKLERDRDRDGDRTRLLHELEGIKDIQRSVQSERDELFAKLEIVDRSFDPGIVVFVRALGVLNEERAKYVVMKAEFDSHRGKYDSLVAEFNTVFQKYGIASDAKNSVEVGTRLEALSSRNSSYKGAVTEKRSIAENIETLEGDLGEMREKLHAVYQRAAVANYDDIGLARKLEDFPEFLKLTKRTNELQPLIDEKNKKLVNGSNQDLIECSKEQLDQEAEELGVEAGKADSLKEERTLILKMIRDSRDGRNVEDKILAQENALEELDNKRSEALNSLAGNYLLDIVENEHEQTQTPRVFNRAVDLFSVFTDYKYELKLSSGVDNPELCALDTQQGDILKLGDLSDGTRTQLLLATKIAYAEEVEQGSSLPLFLDETLVQSDPDRFSTIIENLGKVAADFDRQIFYLTSNPFDIERITYILTNKGYAVPGSIDVAAARSIEYRITSPTELIAANEVAVVPSPEGLSAADYAVLLEVQHMDPMLGPLSQHIYYLLMDDSELLYKFIRVRISSTGQWRRIASMPIAEEICGNPSLIRRLNGQLELLERFCSLWCLGRGRAINRTSLEDSGAFSPSNIDDATEICTKLEGNAQAFLSALENKELKRYPTKKLEMLTDYLIEGGYVDRADVLDEDEIFERMLTIQIGAEMSEMVRADVPRWYKFSKLGLKGS
jgi:DNA repair protein SbcC/Rad50